MKNNKKLVWALVALLILIVFGGWSVSAPIPLGWQSGPGTDETQTHAERLGHRRYRRRNEPRWERKSEAAKKSEDDDGAKSEHLRLRKEGRGHRISGGGRKNQNPRKTADASSEDSDDDLSPAETCPATVNPTFDLVRVEPDGSTLIAGQAAPGNGRWMWYANGEVIGNGKGRCSSGDFACRVILGIILGKNPPPGASPGGGGRPPGRFFTEIRKCVPPLDRRR